MSDLSRVSSIVTWLATRNHGIRGYPFPRGFALAKPAPAPIACTPLPIFSSRGEPL
jgi:hypothetical protein